MISLALALVPSLAEAAAQVKRAVEPTLAPLRVTVVRSNEPACAGHCSDWISLEGPIGPGSLARFTSVLRTLGDRKLPVLINSPGGSVNDAMAIGRLIRARHLDVAVSKTVLTSCPGDRTACETPSPRGVITGAPVTNLSVCASACSFVLAAGTRRFVAMHTYVGVHQFRTFRNMVRTMRTFRVVTRQENGVKVEVSRTLIAERPVSTTKLAVQTPDSTYAQAQSYFTAMGIAPNLMTLAEATDSNAIHWLNLAELVSTGMDTEGKDGAYLIAHADVARDPNTNRPLVTTVDLDAPLKPAENPVFERAFLTTHDQDRENLNISGHVTWSAEAAPPTKPALLASIDLEQGAGSLTMRLSEDPGAPLHTAYHMAMAFHPGADSPFRTILAVGVPEVRPQASHPPVALEGAVTQTGPNDFDIDLWPGTASAGQTTMLLRGSNWYDIPLIASPFRRVRISIERGPYGALEFERWRAFLAQRASLPPVPSITSPGAPPPVSAPGSATSR